MSWQSYIKQFSDYLKLERSLSANSIEAYVRDVEKLDQYVSLHHVGLSPLSIKVNHLQGFLEFINELGMRPIVRRAFFPGSKRF